MYVKNFYFQLLMIQSKSNFFPTSTKSEIPVVLSVVSNSVHETVAWFSKYCPLKMPWGQLMQHWDYAAVLLFLLTTSWPTPMIPTNHLEERTALENLIDPLFGGHRKSNTSSLSLSVTGGILILYRLESSGRSLIAKPKQKPHLTSTKKY